MIELTLFEYQQRPDAVVRKVLINPSRVQYVCVMTQTRSYLDAEGKLIYEKGTRRTTSHDVVVLNFSSETEDDTGFVAVEESFEKVRFLLSTFTPIRSFVAGSDNETETLDNTGDI